MTVRRPVLLDHAACTYRSKENAHTALAVGFGLEALYEFTLDEVPAQKLLGIARPVEIVVFGSHHRLIEAFVVPESANLPGPNHLCLVMPDLDASLKRCATCGFEVRKAWVGDHEVYFAQDMDGNLFELKQAH